MPGVPRKRRTREHIIADLSVNHVERRAGFSLEEAPARVNVRIPLENVVDESAVRRLASFRDAILRQMAGGLHHDD